MSPHFFLLLLLLTACTALCRGAPLAGELRCRCVHTVSEVIPPRRLARVELVPEGPHCAVPEVIVTTKQGQMVCLNPSAPWVQLIVAKILNRWISYGACKRSRVSRACKKALGKGFLICFKCDVNFVCCSPHKQL